MGTSASNFDLFDFHCCLKFHTFSLLGSKSRLYVTGTFMTLFVTRDSRFYPLSSTTCRHIHNLRLENLQTNLLKRLDLYQAGGMQQ